ncbi:MAG: hypothetical protein COS82_11395 [Zetaproteobacteria bacterium CG06_land_8_20_14_3_00_59_53]|nr:MAG: hypothetical protein AUK36_00935 [Zetaproteobacteria bacterium CG2_30_59_37]PIO90101.1 MAG: hypothetical protein COX56_04600 [Zetaproteobacteria bacterium CG23_combo_of_CG06-09_8_20_14_all_59_86]PIQ64822.1 MAG: hypothetical protein COV97_07070 [Zetaproteobacteria bacterium CG11_big_fil_rev_8_21_14_0_20_59_439]PIU69501.1 MAG: hypothetical protein COS82_11395 [Zetaproteobacteria bacterium CG06_land_8_20_14_3_00_59_53]PIU96746.1 MAG: hypothetical protein COS62_07005 [Zetaproteobacteria bac
MNKYFDIRFMLLAGALSIASFAGSAYAATAPLAANTSFIVTLEKFLSNGTVSAVSSTTVISDANGKIAFTFSNVPTCPTSNFLSIKVTTAADTATVVRRSFAPAPPANATNGLGANGVSTKQGEAMVTMGALIGSDDPLAVLFGLMFTRTDVLTPTDISSIGTIGQEAVINGMEPDMLANGVTAAQLTTFKQKLVCANTGKKDLSHFTSLFKSAVDTPAQAQADMAKAAGLLGDIVIDAAEAAGIDLDVFLAAFDTAGDKVNTGAGAAAMAAMSASVRNSMMQSVNSFSTRIGVQKVQARYASMLNTLGVSGTAVTRFNTAVAALGTAMAAIDTTYAKYFDDPVNWPMTPAIRTAIDNAYQAAFGTFQTSIASTNPEITQMQTNIATGLGNVVTQGQLAASGVGSYWDFNGNQVNWPIPQTGATNFVASALAAGGSLSYSRSSIPIPANLIWMGSCAGGAGGPFFDKNSCQGGGGVWTAARSTFPGVPTSFAALQGIQEDLQIAEFTRFGVYTGTETAAQRNAAKIAFKTNVANIIASVGGTTDGTTAFTTAQKRAIVLSQQQPSIR